MKNYIVLFFFFLIVKDFSAAQAQDIEEKPIDFLDIKNATFEESFSHGNKARVKIFNINRFIYKVTESKTEEDFNVAVPAILSSIKLPSFLTTQFPTDATPVNTDRTASVAATKDEFQNELNYKLKELIKSYRGINKRIEQHNNIVHLSKKCNMTFASIESSVKTELGGGNGDKITDLADKVEKDITDNIKLSNTIVDEMESSLKGWITAATIEQRGKEDIGFKALEDLKKALENLERDFEKANDTDKPGIFNQIIEARKRVGTQTRTIERGKEDFETLKSENEAIVEKAKAMTAEINKYKEEGNFFKLVDDIKKVNESNYTYYSETVVMKKDEYTFKISAVSEEPLVCNMPMEQKIEVVLRTKGGVKLDFSTGAFFMFGSRDFLGRTYSFKPLNEKESTVAESYYGKGASLGIGALMHIYCRSSSKVKFGGAVGVSSTVNFDALNFHIGPSLIVGDKDRFCISLGLTFREAKLLGTDYKLGGTYETALLPETVPTYSKFPKAGWFLALTYNISRFNK